MINVKNKDIFKAINTVSNFLIFIFCSSVLNFILLKKNKDSRMRYEQTIEIPVLFLKFNILNNIDDIT